MPGTLNPCKKDIENKQYNGLGWQVAQEAGSKNRVVRKEEHLQIGQAESVEGSIP